jgi:hypothetical protein
MQSFLNDWRTLAGVLALSCTLILVRTVYRVIEYAQGYYGALATNEHYFYALDALPLAVAIGAYVLFWPERLLPPFSMHQDVPYTPESGYSAVKLRRPRGAV